MSTETPSLDTVQLQRCVQRWQAGDRAAADELFRAASKRLENLARKMLRSFPNVQEYAETLDVLQGAVVRLLRSLQEMQPAGTRDFINLAAVHIRRELLDLARHFSGKKYSAVGLTLDAADNEEGEPAATAEGHDLELWRRFHEAVEQLPTEEGEVVGLTFYHGWTQAQIAELFQIDERTVRRRWQSACLKLNRLVGGELPQP